MLLWLAQYFQQELGPLRVFNFITFRAVFATLTALLIGLAAGIIITIVVMSNTNQIHEHDDEPLGDMVDVKDLMRRWEND